MWRDVEMSVPFDLSAGENVSIPWSVSTTF